MHITDVNGNRKQIVWSADGGRTWEAGKHIVDSLVNLFVDHGGEDPIVTYRNPDGDDVLWTAVRSDRFYVTDTMVRDSEDDDRLMATAPTVEQAQDLADLFNDYPERVNP